MSLKRQQLKASQAASHTGTPLSPLPVTIVTPAERRARQTQQPPDDVEHSGPHSGRPVLRRHKTVVFELVTERPKQTIAAMHAADDAKVQRKAAVEFQLVLEKPQRALSEASDNQQQANNTTQQDKLATRATVTADGKRSSNSVKHGRRAKRADKENMAATAPLSTKAAASSNTKRSTPAHLTTGSSAFSRQPTASRLHTADAKAKPAAAVPRVSLRPPSMAALRQELSALPLQLLQSELTRIGQHCRDTLPSFPSLHPASPRLSALLRWLQTVCWAVSSERRCQPLRVDNFTTALSDGLAMSALLDWYGLAQHPFSQLRWHKQAKLYRPTDTPQPVPPTTDTSTTAATATADEDASAVEQSGKGWSCSFSFSELTRTDPSDEQSAANHNWTLFLSSLHTLSQPLFLCCPFSAEFFYGGVAGGRGCDERVVVVFLCRLASELLARSEQLHAVRRLQRWWRRCVDRRNMTQAVKQLLARAAEERQTNEQCGEEDIEVVDQSMEDVPLEECEAVVNEVWTDSSVDHVEVLAVDDDNLEWAQTTDAYDLIVSPGVIRMSSSVRNTDMNADREDRTSALTEARRQAELQQQLQDEQTALAVAHQQAAEQRAAHQLQLARQQAKQKYQRTVDAVTVLQAAWRGKQARQQYAYLRELKRRTEELEQQKRVEAAICVQRVWRGYRLRKDVRLILSIKAEVEVELAEQVERLKQQRAATVIQSLVRGWLARRTAQRLREQKQAEAQNRAEQAEREQRQQFRDNAALLLPPVLRRHVALVQEEQLLAQQQRLHELQDASARVIQRAWRGWRKRQAVVVELREEIQAARIESVVIGLQARVRGKLARRAVQRLRDEKAAKAKAGSEAARQDERRREEHSRLLRRVQHLNAVVIQRQVRVWLAKRRMELLTAAKRVEQQQLLVEQQRCAVLIQSVWRGYRQRKATPGLASRRTELALVQRNAAASPHLRVAERCATAMSALLNARSLSAAIRACQSMSHLAALLPSLCVDIADHQSTLPALLSLIRSAGRTAPHTELVLVALALLNQLAAHPTTTHRLYTAQPLLLPTLTEQLQLSRDNSRVTRRIVRLLRCGERWQQWRVAVRASEAGSVRRRLDGVCELLERKCRTERRYVLGVFAVAGSESSEQTRSRQEREAIAANLRKFLQIVDTDVV